MKKLLAALGIMVACLIGNVAAAPLSLSLSSPNSLLRLSPGDVAVINVDLVGLETGEQLVSLTGSVLFPAALLGTPVSISPGPIVPVAPDFHGTPFAGQADGTFPIIASDLVFIG